MVVQDETKDKKCCFYVSDFHLEMIILPEINRKFEEKEDVIILTQKDLSESLEILISKINLKEENKEKVLKLNWNGKKEILKENSNIIIIGSKKFIEEKNQEIKNKNLNIRNIIDCYDFEEVKEDINNIANLYKNQLNTLGNNKF